MDRNKDNLLSRLERYTGLLLLPTLLIFFISGYGIVNTGKLYPLSGGLLERGTAYEIHTNIALPTLILFITHSGLSVRSYLRRIYPRKNIDIPLTVCFALLFALLVYLGVP
jgi:hypothetical protein